MLLAGPGAGSRELGTADPTHRRAALLDSLSALTRFPDVDKVEERRQLLNVCIRLAANLCVFLGGFFFFWFVFFEFWV